MRDGRLAFRVEGREVLSAALSSGHQNLSKERITRIFQFLRAYNDQRHPAPRRIEQQPWQRDLANLPQHPCVRYVGGAEFADDDADAPAHDREVILTVRRPTTTEPPEPPASLVPMLVAAWKDPFLTVSPLSPRHAEQAAVSGDDDGNGSVATDSTERGQRQAWIEARTDWARTEQHARRALSLFEEIYALYALMEREGERHELILGEGMLFWRHRDGAIEHPVLLQRLSLEFDARQPEFRLRESALPPEIYSGLITALTGVDSHAVARIRDHFNEHPCHPLGGAETEEFLSFLAVQLSPRGHLVATRPSRSPEDPVIVRGPFLFQRTRTLGFGTAIEAILEDIAEHETARCSTALMRIAGIEPPGAAPRGPKADDSLAEDQVVLSKPANLEQIRIAERLESHGAVLVQGPPGTGKTHTIANLVGHLLAHGKTVLITADTTKALRVVREQVDERLRPLCVSALDNDLDGRKQLEEAVLAIAHDISQEDTDVLRERARERARVRREQLEKLERAERELYEARTDEYRPLTLNGQDLSPADAAREVVQGRSADGFIPGPLKSGASLPLSAAEVRALYQTNRTTTKRDEEDFHEGPLPDLTDLPVPADIHRLFRGDNQREPTRAELWPKELGADAPARLAEILTLTEAAVAASRIDAPWHLAALQAGFKGGATREPWDRLLSLVATTETLVASAREHFVQHAPYVELLADESRLLSVNWELMQHVQSGKGLGALQVMFKPRFREYLSYATVGGRRPELPAHFEALKHYLQVRQTRRELATRWNRLLDGTCEELGAELEIKARQVTPLVESQLDWYTQHCVPLAERLARLGFEWNVLLTEQAPPDGAHGEILRLRETIRTRLAVEIRAKLQQHQNESAEERLARIVTELSASRGEQPHTPRAALVRAIETRDEQAYQTAHERIVALTALRKDLELRAQLLLKLEDAAPGWADAIRQRRAPHNAGVVPGNVESAFRWTQLNEELDRRGARSLASLQAKRERCHEKLAEATSELIEARAWLAQKQRMTLQQQQALTGWLDTQRAIGKGTGKKVPELKAEARRLMSGCQTAVPVWIMPLSRLVESFDPRSVRFDVVIVDEASQCDLLALVALYFGRKVVVVGDHEQVSPSAVGESVESSAHLIAQHLRDIPNAHLYDGKLSVYDLARQSFGGMLVLREHFRSLPQIIEFSNQLSYAGRILPLRDGSRGHLLPSTVAFRVEGARSSAKVNPVEARAVAALILAASEQREYDGATFGVVSLLGQEQAYEIESLIRRYLSPSEFERRRIVCGNAAHFQGDERTVMFLSLVDTADGGVLPLRDQQGFKQRFNVAASRARDQMWVVHSLDPQTDLKPEDLRRRLILHAETPETVSTPAHTEKRETSELERSVFQALRGVNYRVHSAWRVGEYCIDMVVEGQDGRRVAVTCDGDRARPPKLLQEDIARQAVLERIGWKFVRVRASQFLRDPSAALASIRNELDNHGIAPLENGQDVTPPTSDLRERVTARAKELMETNFAGLDRPSGVFAPRPKTRTRRPKVATP